ncbi:hypothetical protein BJ546DRAFT_834404 [Cryomyces antarcticus]|nr:hypothetical protein LTR04_007204 [Oleoguttula sp. CCFEE 6159]
MASDTLSARLKYLHESAHLLATSSPAISASLESQYDKLVFENGLDVPESRRREVCASCGNIMAPESSSHVVQEKPIPARIKRKGGSTGTSSALKHARPDKIVVYQCNRCNSKTRFAAKGPPPVKTASILVTRTPSAQHSPSPASALPSSETSTPKPPNDLQSATNGLNASSKKRAKARKQGGLQALLARSKNEGRAGPPSSGFGLDLMDLMKSD